MSKNNYFDQVREYQKDHPSLTWKECCADVSLFIQSSKNDALAIKNRDGKKSKFTIIPAPQTDDVEMIPCIRCGYEIPEPGKAFVCAACGIQN